VTVEFGDWTEGREEEGHRDSMMVATSQGALKTRTGFTNGHKFPCRLLFLVSVGNVNSFKCRLEGLPWVCAQP
jgi:hypothetical protein